MLKRTVITTHDKDYIFRHETPSRKRAHTHKYTHINIGSDVTSTNCAQLCRDCKNDRLYGSIIPDGISFGSIGTKRMKSYPRQDITSQRNRDNKDITKDSYNIAIAATAVKMPLPSYFVSEFTASDSDEDDDYNSSDTSHDESSSYDDDDNSANSSNQIPRNYEHLHIDRRTLYD
jgi:hypothetical protein